MKRFKSNSIGIDQGDVVLFSDFEHDGVMWKGDGPRQTRAYVQFAETFLDIPAVRVYLAMWDISNAGNARADLISEDVTTNGFAIVFRTWGDTKVARVKVSWQAIGPLPDDEVWQLN